MKIVNIKINNYKSLGEDKNLLTLDDVTCIIGKNESGKTNIIDGLSGIKLFSLMDSNYFTKRNRKTSNNVTIEMVLTPYKTEKLKYKKIDESKIFIENSENITISGGISDVILADIVLNDVKDELLQLSKNISFNYNGELARNQYSKFLNKLQEIDSKIIKLNLIKTIKEIINNNQSSKKIEILNLINRLEIHLKEIYELFPTMLFLDSDTLKTNYKREDIKNTKDLLIVNDNKMLNIFLKVAGIELSLIEKFWTTPDKGEKSDLLNSFNKLIEENISKKFNEFYNQDSISCSIMLEKDTLSILIKTGVKNMEFSERSNGLKWYFNTFIKMLNYHLQQKNIVYLLDEPGVFLHVNAQKELLRFFDDLATKENQIVYTTHSPYMINQEGMGTVRLVSKKEDSVTSISNSYNSFPLDNTYGSQETLTPFLQAIGLDLKYNIGPDSKKINIIVEGISDFYYLSAVKIMCNRKFNNIYIIPSVGASQINKIVSILIGWGYDYRILLDNDDSGRKEYKELFNKLGITDKITFSDKTKVLNGKINHELENNFSQFDYARIVINPLDYKGKKRLVSQDIYNRAKKGEKVFDEETLRNFSILIESVLLEKEENCLQES